MQSSHRDAVVRVSADTSELLRNIKEAWSEMSSSKQFQDVLDEALQKKFQQMSEAIERVSQQTNQLKESVRSIKDDGQLNDIINKYLEMQRIAKGLQQTMRDIGGNHDTAKGLTSGLDEAIAKVEKYSSIMGKLDSLITQNFEKSSPIDSSRNIQQEIKQATKDMKAFEAQAKQATKYKKALSDFFEYDPDAVQRVPVKERVGQKGKKPIYDEVIKDVPVFDESKLPDQTKIAEFGQWLLDEYARIEAGLKGLTGAELESEKQRLIELAQVILNLDEQITMLTNRSGDAIYKTGEGGQTDLATMLAEVGSPEKYIALVNTIHDSYEDIEIEGDTFSEYLAKQNNRYSELAAQRKQEIANLKAEQDAGGKTVSTNLIALKGGKIQIPVELGTTVEALLPQLNALIESLQSAISEKKIQLQAELSSTQAAQIADTLVPTAQSTVSSVAQPAASTPVSTVDSSYIADLEKQIFELKQSTAIIEELKTQIVELQNAAAQKNTESNGLGGYLSPERFEAIVATIVDLSSNLDIIRSLVEQIFQPEYFDVFKNSISETKAEIQSLNGQLKTTLELLNQYLSDEVALDQARERRSQKREKRRASVTDFSNPDKAYKALLGTYAQQAKQWADLKQQSDIEDRNLSIRGLSAAYTRDPNELMQRTSHYSETLLSQMEAIWSQMEETKKEIERVAVRTQKTEDEILDDLINIWSGVSESKEARERALAKHEDRTQDILYRQEEKDRNDLAKEMAKGREKAEKERLKAEERDQLAAEQIANKAIAARNQRVYEEEEAQQREYEAYQQHLADMEKLNVQAAEQDIQAADKSKQAKEKQLKGSEEIYQQQLDAAVKAAEDQARAYITLQRARNTVLSAAINKDNINGSGADFDTSYTVANAQKEFDEKTILRDEAFTNLKQAPIQFQTQYYAALDKILAAVETADAEFAEKIRVKRHDLLENIRTNFIETLSEFLNSFNQQTLKGITDASGEKITANELIQMDDAEIAQRFSNISSVGQQSLIDLRERVRSVSTDINNELANIDLKNLTSESAQEKIDKYTLMLNRLKEIAGDTAKSLKGQTFGKNTIIDPQYLNLDSIDAFHTAVDKYVSSIQGATNVSGEFSKNGLKWTGQFIDANGVVQQLTLSFNQLNGTMEKSQFAGGPKGANVKWITDGFSGLKSGTKDIAKMAAMFLTFGNAAHGAMMLVRSSMQTGKQAVLDYDKSLTAIKYTMNMTEEQFDALGKSTVQMARDLRLSIKDAMSISQIYANMQTTSEEILTTARPTAILSNLTGVGTEEAANYIQSVQQQFDMLDSEASHIVDVYDKVSASIKMDYSKGVKNIAGGVQAAGQVAHDAGLSFEELAAIIGKVTERTREEGSAIGNALKTIITRVSKASKLSGADEVDNETISKAAKALHDVGVEVYERNGEFRNLRDILSELAAVWNDLTDAQRANISFEVAATRQSNKFKAILLSLTDSLNLAAEAQNALGNAEANQEKYLKSMGGLMQGIKTNMESFWLSMYNDDAIKGVMNFGVVLTDRLNELVDVVGAPGIAIGTAIAWAIFAGLKSAMVPILTTKMSGALIAIGSGWGATIAKHFGISLTAEAADTVAHALGGLAVTGIAAGLATVYALTKKHAEAIENSRAAAEKEAKAIRDQSDSYESLREEIKKNQNILNDQRSTEEQIVQAKQNLWDIQQQLISVYGKEADGIDLVNGKYKEQIQLIDNLNKDKANQWLREFQQEGIWGTDKKTGRRLAEEAEQFLSGPLRNNTFADFFPIDTTTGLSRAAQKTIQNVVRQAGLNINEVGNAYNPDLTAEEYKQVLESLNTSLDQMIEAEEDPKIRGDLSQFQGRVSSGLSDVVAAIERAQAYLEPLLISRLGDSPEVNAQYSELSEAYKQAIQEFEDGTIDSNEYNQAKDALNSFISELKNAGHVAAPTLSLMVQDMVRTAEQSAEFARQNAIGMAQRSDLAGGESLRDKGYSLTDVQDGSLNTLEDTMTYTGLKNIFEAAGASVDDLNNYLIKTGILLSDVKENGEEAGKAVSFLSFDGLQARIANLQKVGKTLNDLYNGLDGHGDKRTGRNKVSSKGLTNEEIGSIYDTFKSSNFAQIDGGKALESFINRLSSARDSAEDTKQILKELGEAWVNAEKVFEGVESPEGLEQLKESLKELGYEITDIEELMADYQDEIDNVISASSVLDLTNETDAQSLASLAEQYGFTTDAAKAYMLQKMIDSGAIDVSGDCAALATVASALGLAANAWVDYYRAKAGAEIIAKGLDAEYGSEDYKAALTRARKYYQETGQRFERDESYSNTKDYERAMIKSVGYAYQRQMDANWSKVNPEALNTTFTNKTPGGSAPKTDPSGGSNSGSKEKEDRDRSDIDWIQRKLDLLEKQHELENKIADDESKSYDARIASLGKLISEDQFRIETLKKVGDTYKEAYEGSYADLQKALDKHGDKLKTTYGEEVKTIEEIKAAVENGAISIGDYGDEVEKAINDSIKSYDTWQDSIREVDDLERELHEHLMEEYQLRIQALQEYNSYIQAQTDSVQNELSLIEARGEVVTEDTYKKMIRYADDQIENYEDQISVYEELLDQLEEGSAEYNSTLASIQECSNAIQQCELNQIEWNEAIKDIPIKRLEKYLAILDDIKTDILNYINEQESVGAVVSADTYRQLMDISNRTFPKLIEKQNEYRKKLKDYEFGSEKYEETATAIQEIDNEISTVITDMNEWIKAILALPINKIAEVVNQLTLAKDSLEDLIADYDTVLSGVDYMLGKQTEEIEKQRDAYEKMMDERIKGINKEIEGIQDVIDALEKTNEEREKTRAIEQAQYDMEKANTQRSIAVIQEGHKEFIADQDAIRAAQQALNEANYQKKLYDLQQEIQVLEDEVEALEKEKEAKLEDYDNQLKFLDDQANKWREITSSIQGARDMLVSLQYLGKGWDTKILTGKDDAIYKQFYSNYELATGRRDNYNKQIESNNRISTLMQAYIDAYVNGTMSLDKVSTGLKSLTKLLDDPMTASENIAETRRLLGGGSFESILSSLEKEARLEAQNYPSYLNMAQTGFNQMDEYSKNWEELKKQVQAEMEQLEKNWKELQQTKTATKSIAKTIKEREERDEKSPKGWVIVDSGGEIGRYDGNDKVSYSGSKSRDNLSQATKDLFDRYGITYHDGIDNGAVANVGDQNKIRALKAMSLRSLKPNEVPAILKAGEVVLNNAQQSTLLSNIGKIANVAKKAAAGPIVNLTMGDLNLPQVRDGNDFANFITMNLSNAVAQSLGAR